MQGAILDELRRIDRSVIAPAPARVRVRVAYPERLVALYNEELDHIRHNYDLVKELDVELLREFEVHPARILGCLKSRLAGLRNQYWRELFTKETLREALNGLRVLKLTKQVMPFLQRVLIHGFDSVVWFDGTDLDQYLRYEGDGACTAPSRALVPYEILANAAKQADANGEIRLNVEGEPSISYPVFLVMTLALTASAKVSRRQVTSLLNVEAEFPATVLALAPLGR